MNIIIRVIAHSLFIISFVSSANSPQKAADDGLIEARSSFLSGVGGAVMLRHLDQYFPTVTVAKGNNIWKLNKSDKPLVGLSYEYGGETYDMDTFLRSNRTNSMIILKDNKIVFETYRNGGSQSSRQNSFSTSKSVISTLIGIALHEGKIESLDQDITDYLPNMKGGGYEGVSIRNALQMSSGTDYIENYVEGDELPKGFIDLQTAYAPLFTNEGQIEDAAIDIKRSIAPGTKFNYSSLETEVLSAMLEAATGREISEYLSEKIWQPAGMESDAYYILAGPEGVGDEMTAGGLNAVLRDYARIGLMMLNKGKANGKQIVPIEWIVEATTPDPDKLFLAPGGGGVTAPFGYQHQWWLLPNGVFTAEGIFGQWIFVDPNENIVIAKNSYWSKAWDIKDEKEFLAFVDAVRLHLK